MKSTKPFYKTWWFIIIIAFVILAVIGAIMENIENEVTEKENTEVIEETPNTKVSTSYKVLDKRNNDSGQTFLTIEVETIEIEVAKQIIEGIVEDPYKATGYDPGRAKIDSLFIQVRNTGSDSVWMNAKSAITQIGLAQTGLEKVNAIEFEENK